MTCKQVCELIVWALEMEATPKEIWDASPTGELWQIWELWGIAENHLTILGIGPRG